MEYIAGRRWSGAYAMYFAGLHSSGAYMLPFLKTEVKVKASNVFPCSGSRDLQEFTGTIVKAQMDVGRILAQNMDALGLAVITPVLIMG